MVRTSLSFAVNPAERGPGGALGGRRLIGLARCNVEAPADGVKTVFRGHQPLYDYLVGWGSFVQLDNFNPKYLPIFSRDVLKLIASGDDSWDEMVPPQVAEIIRQRGFFDYKKKA